MKIWHPLINPDQKGATIESNHHDMEVIRSLPEGDKRREYINSMIESNIPLVILKVRTYIELYPSLEFLKADLINEGLLALTQAINILAKEKASKTKDNPTGYIGNRIIWALTRLVEKDDRAQVSSNYELPYLLKVDPMALVDTNDLLDVICQTPEDKIIIKMRSAGSTDQEVADRLDVPRTAIRLQRHELMQRYDIYTQRLLNDSPNNS